MLNRKASRETKTFFVEVAISTNSTRIYIMKSFSFDLRF